MKDKYDFEILKIKKETKVEEPIIYRKKKQIEWDKIIVLAALFLLCICGIAAISYLATVGRSIGLLIFGNAIYGTGMAMVYSYVIDK